VATPPDLYERPANAFVARFVGENNRLLGTVREVNGRTCVVAIEGGEVRALAVNVDGVGSRSTLGVYFAYAPFGLTGSLLGLTLAHTALAAPFVVITVSATLQGFDLNQARAGASLGASPVMVLRRIILPLILPGVVSGALFAFVTSFDEVVVALFLTGPAERTLPRQMFNGIRENISPVIAAAATLVILLSVLLLTVLELLRRRNERLRGISA
jgi:putative spermidine/putrescine transport system permease protein